MTKKIDIKESWEKMAKDYQEKYGKSLMFYEESIHLKLFGSLQGKKMLDLGCGGGQTSIFFARQGAIVTGLDFAKTQIDLAREEAKKVGCNVIFLQQEIDDLSNFDNCSFDVANSSHVVHYVKKIQRCFNEVCRVLKPGGKFVFSASHPFNHIVDIEDSSLVIKRSYFSKGKYRWDWGYPEIGKKYPLYLFIRTISDYFIALRKAGFMVEDIIEPRADVDVNSPWYNSKEPKEEMIPGALIFGARKP